VVLCYQRITFTLVVVHVHGSAGHGISVTEQMVSDVKRSLQPGDVLPFGCIQVPVSYFQRCSLHCTTHGKLKIVV